jgi:hypothetical protein
MKNNKARLTLNNVRGGTKRFEFDDGSECVDELHEQVLAWVDANPLEADGMTVHGHGDYDHQYTLIRDGDGWNVEIDGKTALPAGTLENVVSEWLEVVTDYGEWVDLVDIPIMLTLPVEVTVNAGKDGTVRARLEFDRDDLEDKLDAQIGYHLVGSGVLGDEVDTVDYIGGHALIGFASEITSYV